MSPEPIPATTYTWSEFELVLLPGRGEVGNLRQEFIRLKERLKEMEERPRSAHAFSRYMRASLGHHVEYDIGPPYNVWK